MKHIQRLLTAATLLLCPLVSMAEPEVQVNGETVALSPTKITLDGDNVNVTFSDGTTSTFDMDEIIVNFSTPTGVKSLQGNVFAINSLVKEQLTITGVGAGESFSILSNTGVTIYKGITDSPETIVNMSGMASGCYLLCVDGKFIKFIKE